MSKDKKINAHALLDMKPADIPLEMQRLGEANRYLLARAATRLVRSLGKDLTPACAEAYGTMFESLGPARLTLCVSSLLTENAPDVDVHAVVIATHPWVSRAVVSGVFGIPLGEAGIGCVPQLGVCDNDKFDVFVLQTQPKLLFEFYDHLVAIAMKEGAVLVDELPPQTV